MVQGGQPLQQQRPLDGLLEPVAGERFGCIVANPPYVVSPDTEYTFRDSGLPGDRISEDLARGLPALLEPGAFATLMHGGLLGGLITMAPFPLYGWYRGLTELWGLSALADQQLAAS